MERVQPCSVQSVEVITLLSCVCVSLTQSLLGGVFVGSPFIRALFPENLEAEKRGRPTTASSKIKVRKLEVRPPLRIKMTVK